ncbi:MAG: TorF family putative porin [Candidatus Fonsibacter lacus]
MTKKIILSSFASLLFLSHAANAEIKIGKGSLTFNAGVASGYVFRGIEQNKAQPSPFVGADFTHPLGDDFGLYLGVWAGASDGTDSHNYEYDVYGGITKTVGITTFDIGYASYMYPGSSISNQKQTAEYYGKITLAPDKQPYTFGIAYYLDDTNGQIGTSGAKIDRDYYEVNATYDFGSFQSKLSYGVWDGEAAVTTVTLSKELATINFDLSYVNASKESTDSSIAGGKDRDYVILQAKKTF